MIAFGYSDSAFAFDEFHVTSTADTQDAAPGDGNCADAAGECTLRAAVMESNMASGPAKIYLPGGTYTLSLSGAGENASLTGDLDLDKSISIIGVDGNPGGTIIQAGTSPASGIDRVFQVNPARSEDPFTFLFDSVTIRYGRNSSDGNGGGIAGYLGSGSLQVVNCVIAENTAFALGSGRGAGIYLEGKSGASIEIKKSKILSNNVDGFGGGAFINSGGSVLISESTIAENTANSGGGGFSNYGSGVFTFEKSTISGNRAYDKRGGGLALYTQTDLNNVTISGNQATQYGGGVFVDTANSVTFKNSTITGNDTHGAYLNNSNSNVTMHNTIVAGNSGGSIFGNANLQASSSYNLFGTGSSGGLTNGVNGNQVGVTDPKLGPLADNGGLTQTHALLTGSPAIDAGDASVISGISTDQRGLPRLADSASDPDDTPTPDIGAFEAHPTIADISDVTIPINSVKTVNFDIGDHSLIDSITATSSNQTLVPNGNIQVTGTGSNRTLTVTPASGQIGSTTITVTAADTNNGITTTASDTFVLNVVTNADLTIAKSHTGDFLQGLNGTYTITVTNAGADSTGGTVTVTDTLPTGLTATAMDGMGWACDVSTLTCSRSDALAANTSYPPITLTVSVERNAPASVVNQAAVSGGGDSNTTNNTATDPTTIGEPTKVVNVNQVPFNGFYKKGDTLNFGVTFSNAVNVSTAGGTPSFPLVIGTKAVNAVYTGGSGSTLLTFAYIVQSGDLDADGISAGAALSLNGGSITDSASGLPVDPTLVNVAPLAGVGVEAVAPKAIFGSVPANGYYRAGQPWDIIITFNENVTVTGKPSLPLMIGSDTAQAGYVSGSGSNTLLFRYTIRSADQDLDGIELGSEMTLNGGTIRDAIGNDMDPALNGVVNLRGLKIKNSIPTAQSLTVPDGGFYRAGEHLDFVVHFNEPVDVDISAGSPFIPLTVGTMSKQAVYQSGDDTDALTFRYTVQADDNDADGIGMGSAISLNGAHIRDVAGIDAGITFTGDASHILIDNDPPAVPVIDLADGSSFNKRDITFKGTGEAASKLQLIIDGTPNVSATVGGDGNWSAKVAGLTDGAHQIKAQSTDAAGNTSSESAPINFSIDATSPNKPVVTRSKTEWTNQDVTVTVTGEAGNQLQYRLNGGSWQTYTGVVTIMDEGSTRFEARQVDGVLNESEIEEATVRIDKTPPVITLKGEEVMNVDVGSTFTDPGVTITDNLAKDLGAIVTGTVDTSMPGNYTLHYNTADLAGNAAAEMKRTIRVVSKPVPPPPPPPSQNHPVTSVRLDQNELTLSLDGDPVTFHATVRPDNATNKQVTWSSSDPDVASVNKNGVVTPLAAGETTITVTTEDGGHTDTCLVTVKEEGPFLKASERSFLVKPQKSFSFTIYFQSKEGEWEDITKSKATTYDVDSNLVTIKPGTIRAGKEEGEAVLTVRYRGHELQIPVTVSKVSVKTLRTSSRSITQQVGQSKQMELMAIFTNNDKKDVTDKAVWASSAPAVVSVSDSGEVKGLKEGRATITAVYGGKKVSIQVNVEEELTLKSLVADKRNVTLEAGEKEEVVLTATYSDGSKVNVTDQAEWKSSNEQIVKVEHGVLEAVAKGKAKVTAEYRGKTIAIYIQVK